MTPSCTRSGAPRTADQYSYRTSSSMATATLPGLALPRRSLPSARGVLDPEAVARLVVSIPLAGKAQADAWSAETTHLKRCDMALRRRLREIASAVRAARFPAPPATQPGDVGGYTGEGPLIRSWMREAERRGKRADAANAGSRGN